MSPTGPLYIGKLFGSKNVPSESGETKVELGSAVIQNFGSETANYSNTMLTLDSAAGVRKKVSQVSGLCQIIYRFLYHSHSHLNPFTNNQNIERWNVSSPFMDNRCHHPTYQSRNIFDILNNQNSLQVNSNFLLKNLTSLFHYMV